MISSDFQSFNYLFSNISFLKSNILQITMCFSVLFPKDISDKSEKNGYIEEK
jgi:hypothetical protein